MSVNELQTLAQQFADAFDQRDVQPVAGELLFHQPQRVIPARFLDGVAHRVGKSGIPLKAK